MTQTISVTRDARGVARLSLSLPDKHNAIGAEMIAELAEAARTLGADPAVRVVVLTGEGKSFCAGGDLRWMQAQIDGDAASRRREARALADMLADLNALPKPLIARVQGNAFGGGVGLCSVADVVIAAEGVRFGLTETRLGLIPATIGPYVLARIGQGAARRLMVSSERFGTQLAREIGLVSTIVDADALDRAVEDQITAYLACGPDAVAAAKALAMVHAPDDRQIEDSIDRLVAQWEGPEAGEGIAAFFGKRAPSWAPD